jgi:Tol biopolymer transport system component
LVIVSGTRLGPYEVLSPLGAGGMGEVYRARDTRLSREVALKVLPTELSADAERLSRFEQEARSASALNHPNIVVVYDVGRSETTSWIAMELIEGKTLRGLLADGPLPERRLLQIAAQAADGLARAHSAGIVHRDLKPENLMISRDGFVKILDFGLVKLAPAGAEGLSEMPTAAPRQTASGVLLGTVGYMSPEQASGRPVDFRSDQFSFGSILYEMVTGRRAFSRPTAAETLAAIIREEPKAITAAELRGTLPLGWLLQRCLAKEPEERYASTRDLARDLANLRDHVSEAGGAPVDVLPAPKARRRIAGPLAGLALLLAGVFLAGRWSGLLGRESVHRQPVFHQLTFRHGNIFSARFAPDGHTVLYGAAWEGMPARVFAARSGSAESSPLALPDADIFSISSSGELLLSLNHRYREGFASRGTLAQAPLAGGAPREMLEEVAGADWAPDGSRLAAVRQVGGKYQLEFPAGRVIYSSPGWISHPRVSPAGDSVAFLDHGSFIGDDRGSVAILGVDGRKKTLSKEWTAVQGLAWSPSGREVWFTAADTGVVRRLYAVSPDRQTRLVLQVPGSLTLHDIFGDGRVLLTRDTLRAGVLAAGPSDAKERDLSWYDFSTVSDLSDDGKTMLLSEQGGGGGPSYAVYLRQMDGSPAVRLGEGFALALSPDKRWALSLLLGSEQELILLPTGTGEARRLPRGPIRSYGYDAKFLPHGEAIVFYGRVSSGLRRLWVQDLKGGEPRALTSEGVDLAHDSQAVSPDGQTVAAAGADGRLWLYPVGGGKPLPIPGSDGKQRPATWSSDGISLFTFEHEGSFALVHRIDARTGRTDLWKKLAPADPAGIIQILDVNIDPSGRTHAYTYVRILSDLYIAEGLR